MLNKIAGLDSSTVKYRLSAGTTNLVRFIHPWNELASIVCIVDGNITPDKFFNLQKVSAGSSVISVEDKSK